MELAFIDPGERRPLGEAQPAASPSYSVSLDKPDTSAPVPVSFFNRELSWLEFNRRVLNEALDERTPLLERVRFLEIFTSNLDEFYMKRVGGIKSQIAAGIVTRTPDGLTPQQQLTAIRKAVMPMLAHQSECFSSVLRPRLAEHGIYLMEWADASEADRQAARKYFRASIFPVLTPLAVDPGHPFPFISNLSDSLGIILCQPGRDDRLFARVKVPETLPRWVRLNDHDKPGEFHFVRVVDIIRNNLQDLFPNMVIVDVMPFRLTRNADIEHEEEDADDLLELIEEELRERRFATVVRLEHGPNPNAWILGFLLGELHLSEEDVYELPGELDYQDLRPVSELNIPALRYEPWTPIVPAALAAEEETDMFSLIRAGDILVHHPYESFSASVERFVKAAAADPKVLAIKMTVYRTGDDSPCIRTLIHAAEARKQVCCLVELKARFDEERNIVLAQALEKAGVHVVYGILGLKTHTKITLVVRQDSDGIRCYAHIGTGNYNVATAKVYTDLGLFTCNPAITEEIVELFHYLTGRSLKNDYKKLLVAPVNMKDRFLGLIAREVEHQKAGRPARITAKMNSLEDQEICRALYAASQAGVPIDLIIRGFCTLRPGLAGLSERIRVISVIGRFLEHSRIFHFLNGCDDPIDGEFYIGSADWMYRNLQTRVEAIVPIEVRAHRERCWDILQTMLRDRRQAWDLQSDGTYIQRIAGAKDLGTQQAIMNFFRGGAGRTQSIITP